MSRAKYLLGVIEQVAVLKHGQSVVIPCEDYRHRSSVRVGLYNAKRKLEKSQPVLAAKIQIRQSTDGGIPAVVVEKVDPEKLQAFVVKGKNDITEFKMDDVPIDPTGDAGSDRISQLMKEDGL